MHFINMSVFVRLKTEFSKRTSFAIAKKINEVSERKKKILTRNVQYPHTWIKPYNVSKAHKSTLKQID